jgi:hypothetical protein
MRCVTVLSVFVSVEFGRVLDKLSITIIRSNCLFMHTGQYNSACIFHSYIPIYTLHLRIFRYSYCLYVMVYSSPYRFASRRICQATKRRTRIFHVLSSRLDSRLLQRRYSYNQWQWHTQEFFSGGVNKFSWGQKELGSGGGSPLVRGSGGKCNLVQEISFNIVKFS